MFVFLNKPPRWFAIVCWLYPVIWGIALAVTALLLEGSALKGRACGLLLLGFPLPVLILILVSRCFRFRSVFMLGVWCVVFGIVFNLTLAGAKSAITAAYRAVVAETK